MNCIDVSGLKGKIKPDAQSVTLKVGEQKQRIILAYQKNGYGQKRFFFCPCCDKRVQYLFISDKGILKCRECSGVKYDGIQNNTKGGYDEIAYRMKRYANKHGIVFDFPFDYLKFVYDRRCRKAKFRRCLTVLQALENMRSQGIFYQTRYNAKLLRQVTTGKHPLVQSESLKDLRDYFYDWKNGKQQTELLTAKEILK